MKKDYTKFRSLKELVEFVRKDDIAPVKLIEILRWPEHPTCGSCGSVSDKHYVMSGHDDTYRCRHCGFKFKATTGTLLQGSKIKPWVFFIGIYLLYHYRDTISEKEMKSKMKLAPTCVLCGEWRRKILEVLPMPYKIAEPRKGKDLLVEKYEAGHVNLQLIFDALLTLKPNKKPGGRGSIDRSTINPINQ